MHVSCNVLHVMSVVHYRNMPVNAWDGCKGWENTFVDVKGPL